MKDVQTKNTYLSEQALDGTIKMAYKKAVHLLKNIEFLFQIPRKEITPPSLEKVEESIGQMSVSEDKKHDLTMIIRPLFINCEQLIEGLELVSETSAAYLKQLRQVMATEDKLDEKKVATGIKWQILFVRDELGNNDNPKANNCLTLKEYLILNLNWMFDAKKEKYAIDHLEHLLGKKGNIYQVYTRFGTYKKHLLDDNIYCFDMWPSPINKDNTAFRHKISIDVI